jgi:hypothetical protein
MEFVIRETGARRYTQQKFYYNIRVASNYESNMYHENIKTMHKVKSYNMNG